MYTDDSLLKNYFKKSSNIFIFHNYNVQPDLWMTLDEFLQLQYKSWLTELHKMARRWLHTVQLEYRF